MSTNLYVENYQNEVRQARGLETKLPVTLSGASATLAVGGTSTFTGVATFTATPVFSGGMVSTTVDATATLAPTAAQSGTTFLLDAAAGFTTTLPAPVVGLSFVFMVVTTITSNSYKIITDASGTKLGGTLLSAIDNTASKSFVADGSTHRSINMAAASTNATGGIIGSVIRLRCVSTTLWTVEGTNLAGGTVTTPFATS